MFILFRLPVVTAAAIVFIFFCHTVWFTTLVTPPGIDTKSSRVKAESSNH